MLDGNEIYSSASIGILHASEKHLSSEDMMRDGHGYVSQGGKARRDI
jgi:hypothetical protein